MTPTKLDEQINAAMLDPANIKALVNATTSDPGGHVPFLILKNGVLIAGDAQQPSDLEFEDDTYEILQKYMRVNELPNLRRLKTPSLAIHHNEDDILYRGCIQKNGIDKLHRTEEQINPVGDLHPYQIAKIRQEKGDGALIIGSGDVKYKIAKHLADKIRSRYQHIEIDDTSEQGLAEAMRNRGTVDGLMPKRGLVIINDAFLGRNYAGSGTQDWTVASGLREFWRQLSNNNHVFVIVTADDINWIEEGKELSTSMGALFRHVQVDKKYKDMRA